MTDANTDTPSAETPVKDAPADTTDWKAEARKWEARAKENKTAADELTAVKDSQKTDQQKFEERLSAMESRAMDAEQKALRNEIASQHGITPADRDFFLTGTDEATLNSQAERLAAIASERKKQGNVARKEGGTTSIGTTESDTRELVKELFGSAD
jgi:uncharacterized protein involved in exopolysaccharide biosynthesis